MSAERIANSAAARRVQHGSDERAKRYRAARASRGACRQEAAEAERMARLQEQGMCDGARFERAARGAARAGAGLRAIRGAVSDLLRRLGCELPGHDAFGLLLPADLFVVL